MPNATITAPPGASQIFISRAFAAPPALVFRAYSDQTLLVQWLGPRRLTMEIDYYEVRDGGRWRYVHREPDGTPYAFHGVFHGEPSVHGIVQTFEYEGLPGHVALEAVTFLEQPGGTLLTMVSSHQSVADRDAMIASGMEAGLTDGLDRLDRLLAELQTPAPPT